MRDNTYRARINFFIDIEDLNDLRDLPGDYSEHIRVSIKNYLKKAKKDYASLRASSSPSKHAKSNT